MQDRHEIKHCINQTDYYVLRSRLQSLLQIDPHAGPDGTYRIRSLYFDTPEDLALREKADGVQNRDKFRIRYYNENPDFICLEKKSKRGNICRKSSAALTEEEARRIAAGDINWLCTQESPLLQELYKNMLLKQLRPKTIVDYDRDPFIYPAGNVRITLDHHIRTALNGTDFLDPACVTIPVPDDPIILEVKWDHFLPDIIRDAVSMPGRRATSYSKYAACRIYDF